MKRKQIFYTLVMAAGLLTACGTDDERIPAEPQTQSAADGGQAPADLTRHISVEVSERPMAEEGTAEGRSLTTRAAITTTLTLGDFTMQGVYGESTQKYSVVKKSAGKWTVTPDTPDSWPSVDNNTKVQFYAYTYTKGTFVPNSGTPFIDFTVDENASTQHDLLVATNSVAYKDHNGTVPLIFDHACAALAFNIFMSNTLSGQLGGTLTVNSIVLKNVRNNGNYNFGTTFDGSTWSDVEGSANYTLNSSSMVITTTPQALSSNHLFMIPQERTANGTDGTYLEISYTFSGQTGNTAIIPLTVDWKKSTQYTINIKLGTTLIK
jgi:hypothetical protein